MRRGEQLVELVEQPYELEDDLQELIERHPNLLAGEQVKPDAPRRWLVLAREVGVPGEEGGVDRWSLDHLLLDQDAIPTLVEVKRSSDSRIRREVVGQMLDYAANAVTYWNLDLLRERFEAKASTEQRDAEAEIATLVGDDAGEVDYAEFWERAKTNLAAGRVRLVFVADTIPVELQRVVEFLNERMSPTDVIAVEIRQYAGAGEQMLVPRVLGQTAEARQKTTGSRPSRQWDEESFLAELTRRRGPEEGRLAAEVIRRSRDLFPRPTYGQGLSNTGFSPALDYNGHSYWPFRLSTRGEFRFQFQWMSGMPPFGSEEKRRAFLDRLNEIPGVEIAPDAITKKPAVPLATFTSASRLAALFSAFEWFVEQAKNAGP